jgi:hypothetical protein
LLIKLKLGPKVHYLLMVLISQKKNFWIWLYPKVENAEEREISRGWMRCGRVVPITHSWPKTMASLTLYHKSSPNPLTCVSHLILGMHYCKCWNNLTIWRDVNLIGIIMWIALFESSKAGNFFCENGDRKKIISREVWRWEWNFFVREVCSNSYIY